MMDDTGSNLTVIKHEDIVWLRTNQDATIGTRGHIPPPPPILGVIGAVAANDHTNYFIIRALEATVADTTNIMMLPAWDTIEVAIHPKGMGKRFLGHWLRSRFFTASAPSGMNNTMTFNKKGGINQHLPNPDYAAGGGGGGVPSILTPDIRGNLFYGHRPAMGKLST
jgi:hypothetical protein